MTALTHDPLVCECGLPKRHDQPLCPVCIDQRDDLREPCDAEGDVHAERVYAEGAD